jgi:protein disulfide-isomerase A1
VDATAKDNEALARKYKVGGYPTLYIFRGGDIEKPQEYEGPREADGIVSYLRRQAGPASKQLKDKDAVTAHVAGDVAVVGLFPKGEKSAEYKAFQTAANSLRNDFELAHVFDASLLPAEHCAEKGACKTATLFVLKKYDEPVSTLPLTSSSSAETISEFVETASTPKVLELSQQPRFRKALSKAFEDAATPKLLIFGNKATAGAQYAALREAVVAAQAEHGEDFHYLMVNSAENAGALNFFGVAEADLPVFAVHRQQPSDGKFVQKGADPATLTSWLNDYKAGKIAKFIKSEAVPEDNSGPVKVLVATNFEELVFNSGKDVLIEAYAPWCGHCKKLAPIYDKVGAFYSEDEGVMIAKIDATANDIPSDKFEVRGFPTLYFYQHKSGKVIKYEGDRTEQSFYDFIAKNRSDAAAAAAGDEEGEAEAEAAGEAAGDHEEL